MHLIVWEANHLKGRSVWVKSKIQGIGSLASIVVVAQCLLTLRKLLKWPAAQLNDRLWHESHSTSFLISKCILKPQRITASCSSECPKLQRWKTSVC